MALLQCPECNREISDKAESCPNCGYVLIKNELPKIRRTQLSEVKKNLFLGILYVFIGIFTAIVGIPFITVIFGIFAIIGGLLFIGLGTAMIKGTQEGLCPYCNNPIKVPAKSQTFKCNHCRKTSTIKVDVLETIE